MVSPSSGSIPDVKTAESSTSIAPQNPATPPAATPAAQDDTSLMSQSSRMLAPSYWAEYAQDTPQEPLDDDSGDSGFEDDAAGSVPSLNSSWSSILNYRIINGRTYHAERGDSAAYWASNDDKQNEALDIVHHMSTLSIDGRLYLAPIDPSKIKTVLDVGTGTGIWAIDFADDHPSVDVTGTDISPIQPYWVPPNLRFEIEDFTKDWTYEDGSFDYVHMRYLYGSVPDWYDLFRRAYRATRPGGWVESYEGSPLVYSDDGTVGEGTALAEWGKFFVEGGKKMGRVFTPLPDHLQEKGMEAAGFVDVRVSTIKVPLGGWPKDERLREVGRYSQLSLETDLEGYVTFMASLLEGWGPDEVLMFCAQMRRELRSGRRHAYYFQRIVCARKPEEAAA